MTTINTKAGDIAAVEVPMEARSIRIINDRLWYGNGSVNGTEALKGDYTILGTLTNGVPDFDVEPYVEKEYSDIYMFYKNYSQDYPPDKYIFSSVMDSWISLLTSKQIDYSNKKLVILLKK